MERVTGGRKAHFGLRSSIAGRWTFNTLSVVGVLLIIANVCIYYFTRQYYYGSAETYLVSEANATATVLTRLYEDMAVNYSTEVRELIEGFDKKDKMEMMSINKNGEVTLSSSGFSPDESYNMPDYEAALKSEDGVGVFHGYETGENIIAVKEASGKMDQIATIAAAAPEGFSVYSGDDSATYDIMRLGGAGVISTTGNVAPERMKELVTKCAEGKWDEAWAAHEAFLPLMNGLFETSNPILVKEALKLVGFPVGGVRLPLVDATPEQSARLASIMREVGVLD